MDQLPGLPQLRDRGRKTKGDHRIVSLIDEAKAAAATARTGPVSVLDRLIANPDIGPEDRDEITELLRAPVVGATAAARVLHKHYAEHAERPITRMMVQQWRSAHR